MAASIDRLFDSLYAKDALAAYAKVYPISSGPLTTGYVVTVKSDGTLEFAPAAGGGSTTLAALTDVNISSPANNDVLQYQTSDNKWHNEPTLVAANIPALDASKITTGLLALARGGTGVDLSATGGTTFVLAQDASHVVSARALVAADIPSLDASKITTGTLAVAQGGTNIGSYTTGDILYASSSSVLAKLAIGGTGKVLTVSGGIPAWADVSGSGGAGVLPTWVAYSADTKPASSHAEDDEFDSSTLDPKWTESPTGAPTIDYDTTVRSHYMMKSTSTGAQNVVVTQPFAATTFSVAMGVRMPYSTGNALISLYIADGAALSNAFAISVLGTSQLATKKRVSGTPTTLTTAFATNGFAPSSVILYLQKTAANTWRGAASTDGGRSWTVCGLTNTVTFTETVIGFQLLNGSGVVGDRFCVDWFRRDFITLY